MHPDSEKELLDRVRRLESRLITLAQALNVDLLALARQAQPDLRETELHGRHVEVRTLDMPIARIRKAIREAWPGHSDPVPVYFEGNMVSAVLP